MLGMTVCGVAVTLISVVAMSSLQNGIFNFLLGIIYFVPKSHKINSFSSFVVSPELGFPLRA